MLYKYVVSTLLNLLLHFLKQQEYICRCTQLCSDIIMSMWPEIIRYHGEPSFYFFNVLIKYSVHSSWKRNVPWNTKRWDCFSWLTVLELQRGTPQILLQAWALCYFTLSNFVSWGWHWNSMLQTSWPVMTKKLTRGSHVKQSLSLPFWSWLSWVT